MPEDTPAHPSKVKVYSVPRRYDLATMFAVSVAYALLFATMRCSGSEPVSFAIVAGFFTFVGLAQALLFGGKAPRAASIVAGVVCWGAIQFVQGILVFDHSLELLVFGSVCGAILGYVAGALIAGVFLVADFVRQSTARR